MKCTIGLMVVFAESRRIDSADLVENLVPERLEEVFWKAVALMPKDDLCASEACADPRLAAAAVFLGATTARWPTCF